MKYFFLLFMLTGSWGISKAQTAEDSVKLAVNTLFDGMRSSDGEMIKAAFCDTAILQTIGRDKDGKPKIETESIADFADYISKQPKGFADERIVFDVVRVDGPLAIVWAPYKVYFNGVFSHCGVDSFQLVKVGNKWKVQYLIDTRKRKGCD